MLFDDIYREIGEFGVYQILIYCLLGLIGIPAGWQNMAVTFLAADMDSWCKVDALQNLTQRQQKNIAIPYENGGYSRCTNYVLNYSSYNYDALVTWNRSLHNYNDTRIEECSEHVYDQSIFVSTATSEWDLSCGDRSTLRALIQTIYMTGFLIGCIVFGQISDKVGRKKTLLAALLMEITFGLGATFCPIYVLFCILRFFVGMGVAGSFTTLFVLSMELIGAKYRMVTGILVQAWFAIGLMSFPWMAYALRDFATLQLVAACCPIVLLLVFFVVPESPRWYVTHGHDEEAEKLIRKIAFINNRECPEQLFLEDNRQGEEKTAKGSLIDLFRGPNIRKTSLLMMFCWFIISLGYYGLSLGVDFLGGSLFFNSFLSGAVELPAYVIAIVLLNKVGRKWPNMAFLLLVALFCIFCVPFIGSPKYNTILTVLLMLGKCFSAGVFSVLYVYSAELFPTVVRNVGLGTCSMFARVSGLLQPQVALTKAVWEPLPFVIYGGTALLAGIASCFFPETLGKELPETLEDLEHFGRKRTSTVTSDQGGPTSAVEKGTKNLALVESDPGHLDEKFE